MNNLLFNNTKERGVTTRIIYQEDNHYVGACLEFDLEVEGKTIKEAEERLDEYTRSWLENVNKNNLSDELLNRPAPKKYWEIYLKINNEQKKLIERKLLQNAKTSSLLQIKPFSASYQDYSSNQFPSQIPS